MSDDDARTATGPADVPDVRPEVPGTPVGFWIGLAIGAPIIAFGIRGALDHLPGVQLTSFVRWFVGAAVVHDLVVGPIVCGAAWLLASRAPRIAVGPLQGAAVSSAVIGVVSWPFVRGYGITPGEASFLSRNYAASVAVIWAAIWLGAAVVIAWRMARPRSGSARP